MFSTIGWWTFANCLFDRATVQRIAANIYTNTMGDCTMHWGTLSLCLGGSHTLVITNCAFDHTIIPDYGLTNACPDANYNAYIVGQQRLQPQGSNDLVTTNFNWQPGRLGNYYLPTNSPLIDHGSTTADQVGLYHFTTQTNQMKETNSIVDIGYHYVALDTNGMPIDSNDDGIPDYLEDANGDGIADGGETNWGIAIFIQPTNQIVVQTSNATFSVMAAGIAPLTYQWYFNGTNLLTATNASLTLTKVQTTNAGTYYVIITNMAGSLTSSNATLTVIGPPVINSQPNSLALCSGTTTANFYVSASSTPPGQNLSYQWQHDGVNLTDGPTETGATNSGSTTTNLTISNVSAGNLGWGWYDVVVTDQNGFSTTSSSVTLSAFQIIGQTVQQKVKTNSPASFSVTVLDPKASFQWQQSTNGGTNFSAIISGATNSTFTIYPQLSQSYTLYRAIVTASASSGGCSLTSAPAILIVANNITNGTVKWIYNTAPQPQPTYGSWPNITTNTTIVESSPAIGSNGTIYINSTDCSSFGAFNCTRSASRLLALNTNGTGQWTFPLGGVNTDWTASPAIGADGTIYSTSDTNLFAFDACGNVRWFVTVKPITTNADCGGPWSPAIGNDGTIYIAVDRDKIYESTPDPYDGDSYLWAINTNGSTNWTLALSNVCNDVSSDPSLGTNGTIYFLDEKGDVVSVSSNGLYGFSLLDLSYEINVGGERLPSPAIDKNGVMYLGDSVYTTPLNTNSQPIWSALSTSPMAPLAASCVLGPSNNIATNGVVYFIDDDDYLFACDPTKYYNDGYGDKGYLLWGIGTQSPPSQHGQNYSLDTLTFDGTPYGNSGNGVFYTSTPAVGADGTVYCGTLNSNIFAIHPPAANNTTNVPVLWQVHTGDSVVSSPVIGADGIIYVGSDDGNVYAIAASNTLATTDWPMYRKTRAIPRTPLNKSSARQPVRKLRQRSSMAVRIVIGTQKFMRKSRTDTSFSCKAPAAVAPKRRCGAPRRRKDWRTPRRSRISEIIVSRAASCTAAAEAVSKHPLIVAADACRAEA